MSQVKQQYEDLPHQQAAIESVVKLFAGQEHGRTDLTVEVGSISGSLGMTYRSNGFGNRLALLPEKLASNLKAVQVSNGLPVSNIKALLPGERDYDVEMETGTGKTFVYLSTIHRLYQTYGFCKFVIVVPSVAIKEGVLQTLDDTREVLRARFGIEPAYFAYESSEINRVSQFATSPSLQIMVVTIGSINKLGDEQEALAEEADPTKRSKNSANVFYRHRDQSQGWRPADLVRATQPIVIVDEPQTVEGPAGAEAIRRLNPTAVLRYSATHKTKHHVVYSLDPIDAYQAGLVKQIYVSAAKVQADQNRPHIRLISCTNRPGKGWEAELELHVHAEPEPKLAKKKIKKAVKLEQVTRRDIYQGYEVYQLREGYIDLKQPDGDVIKLAAGVQADDGTKDELFRHLIRRTIELHLERESVNFRRGIKTLSLFFIDKVESYRTYVDGKAQPGKLASMFEEEYAALAKQQRFRSFLPELEAGKTAAAFHNGYFSADNKMHTPFEDVEFKSGMSKEQKDSLTYKLIMRGKSTLLSLDEPLRFIFSHSALREGWDNPNVFQICSLREMSTDQRRRQAIGRGLRLCVDYNGHRIRDPLINRLTVVGTESYQSFAKVLQTELEDKETGIGIRFGYVAQEQLSGLGYLDADGDVVVMGEERAKRLVKHLQQNGLVSAQGELLDGLHDVVVDHQLALGGEFELAEDLLPFVDKVEALLGKLSKATVPGNDGDNPPPSIKTRPNLLQSDAFRALWERIQYRTQYQVRFDESRLIKACAESLSRELDPKNIKSAEVYFEEAAIQTLHSGVISTDATTTGAERLHRGRLPIPDLLTAIASRTGLTRKAVRAILVDSGRLDSFERNPQLCIDRTVRVVNAQKRPFLARQISYDVREDLSTYDVARWEEEVIGHMSRMMHTNPARGLHDAVRYDSKVELEFAQELDRNEGVKLYAKLPSWFRIPTPDGDYIADWAIVFEDHSGRRLYFVCETKSTPMADELSTPESAKVYCGEAHFKALSSRSGAIHYQQVHKLSEVNLTP